MRNAKFSLISLDKTNMADYISTKSMLAPEFEKNMERFLLNYSGINPTTSRALYITNSILNSSN